VSFGEHSNPVARKEHCCEWCYGPIPIGEKYSKWVGIWEGEFQCNKLHMECNEVCQRDDPYNEGWTPGEGEMPERIKALVVAK
jgi:hypothetical protein